MEILRSIFVYCMDFNVLMSWRKVTNTAQKKQVVSDSFDQVETMECENEDLLKQLEQEKAILCLLQGFLIVLACKQQWIEKETNQNWIEKEMIHAHSRYIFTRRVEIYITSREEQKTHFNTIHCIWWYIFIACHMMLALCYIWAS